MDPFLQFLYDRGAVALIVTGIVAGGLALWNLVVAGALKRWPELGTALAAIGPYLPWFFRSMGRAFENRARKAKGLPPLPYEPPVPESAGPPPKTRPPTLPLVCFLLLAGCAGGPPAAQIDRGIAILTEAIPASEPVVREARKRELAACEDDACVERVVREWAPVVAMYEAVRVWWCEVAPSAEGCS